MFCCCFGTCLSSISESHLVALYLECCCWDLFEFHFWISFGRQVFEVLLVDPFWVPFLNLIWSPCIVWLSSCSWFRLTTVLREFGCFHVTRIEMWVTGLFSCMTWRMFRFSWRWWRRSSCVCRRNDDTCVGFCTLSGVLVQVAHVLLAEDVSSCLIREDFLLSSCAESSNQRFYFSTLS